MKSTLAKLIILLCVQITAYAAKNSVGTDLGQGADVFVTGGSKGGHHSGGSGLILTNDHKQESFRRIAILRFDLSGRELIDNDIWLKLTPETSQIKKEIPPVTLKLYGVVDGNIADKAPDDGGWTEGKKKKGEATDATQLTWDRLETMLSLDLMNPLDNSDNVKLLVATTVSDYFTTINLGGNALKDFLATDTNQLVTFILIAEGGFYPAKSKEWNTSSAPKLYFGDEPAVKNLKKKQDEPDLTSYEFIPTNPALLGDYEKALLAEYADLPTPSFVVGVDQEDVLKRMKVLKKAKGEIVSVDDAPFKQAMRIETESGLRKGHEALVTLKTDVPIEAGDVVLITYYFRTLDSTEEAGRGGGRLWFVPNGWKGKFNAQHFFGSSSDQWTRMFLGSVAKKNYPKGGAQFDFQLGSKDSQTIEIGGFSVMNFGNLIKLEDLPKNEFKVTNYKGREPDAEWRKEALARIEDIRKADFNIRVLDSDGQPVEGAEIVIEMQKHAFYWGGAFGVHMFTDSATPPMKEPISPGRKQKYRDYMKSGMFNSVTLENALKWPPWLEATPFFKREWTMDAIQWLHENDFRIYGHAMHWGMRRFPKEMGFPANSPEGRQAVLDHIHEIGSATKEYVRHWDVVNEHAGYNDSTHWFGDEFMLDVFKTADEATDGADLYWNDNSILTSPGVGKNTHSMVKWIDYLTKHDAPIDGIGFQCHFWGDNLPEPTVILGKLDRFGKYGLDIHISEFDIGVEDPEDSFQAAIQKDFTRDFLILAFSHPAVAAITHWSPVFPAYRKDRQMTKRDLSILMPHGEVWKELVTDTWWTRETGVTDSNGICSIRGFLGDYAITVIYEGQKKVSEISLGIDGSNVDIHLNSQVL